jgi:type VI secretion system protein VasG
VGAGGPAGGADASNLLKPALARGELRTCAATTWTEYKKYFEKDPALARRFQLVSLPEPDAETTGLILQGLRERYEKAHGVVIRADSLTACAQYADRYITGRFLPDKAIDLLDTTAARVKINLSAKPGAIEDIERAIQALERTRAAMERDRENGSPVDEQVYAESGLAMEAKKAALAQTKARYEAEKTAADKVLELRARLLAAPDATQKASLAAELTEADLALAQTRDAGAMLAIEVTPELVAQVVSDWTGIPLGKVQRDESQAVLLLDERLGRRIKGQDAAVGEIATALKASKSGMRNPDQPLGVFLLVGPSGVGKTETALALADLLFGGEKNAVTINMTEFTEGHTVSRLIGSPPGYVGYGEGGMLTEAVRQRPYSVVVLDEAEKAHLQVMELFYQVFDKGVLQDGEGKEISFKNAVILLTSNLGSDVIQELTSGAAEPVPAEALMAALRPILSQHFKPALLARMRIVPYVSLSEDALSGIAREKLDRLAKNLQANSRMSLRWDDAVPQAVAKRCTEVETGARNIEAILSMNILPRLSQAILESMAQGAAPASAALSLDAEGGFTITFVPQQGTQTAV